MIFVKKYRYQKIETTDSLVVLPFGVNVKFWFI